ncbi:uncharacterized protein LOC114253990 [Monomorium pharaonis]|uniref:uncharacterized protein LOC114253990 n=1 Tax=Monomorium pharaonis TaxID=307658 RepID=UPI0017462D95|nr:uncharacterized protein LOC114253990 [Monomorium pharaonis]
MSVLSELQQEQQEIMMFLYQELFLVMIILTSIVLANVQHYEYQSGKNPHYSTRPQYKIIHQNRRLRRSDSTSPETSTSTIVAHGNDVIAKSPLTDTKHLTIDSLLPEHEPINTNDKRVENREIKDDYMTMPRYGMSDILFPVRYPSYNPDKMQMLQNYLNAKRTEATTASQRKEPNCNIYTDYFNLSPNKPSIRFDPPMETAWNDDYRDKYREAWVWPTSSAPQKYVYHGPNAFKFFNLFRDEMEDNESITKFVDRQPYITYV